MTAGVERRGTALATPVVMSTASQGLSGASNFVIILALGREGGTAEVGRYALAFIAYSGALGIQRATLTDALMARRLGSTAPLPEETNRALVCSMAIAAIAAVVVAAIGLIGGVDLFALLAPLLLLVLVEDACRFLLFRNGRHSLAAVIDGIWFAVSCTAFIVLRSNPDATAALAVWGAGGALAALTGLALLRFRPTGIGTAVSWWRANLWPSSRFLVLETSFFQADQQIVAFGFTAMAGAAMFGTYQLAGSLVGLSIMVTTGIAVVAVSRFTHGEGTQIKAAATVSLVSFGCVAAVTLAFTALSVPLVRLLYGDHVTIPKGTILATGAIYAGAAAAGGVHALLRSRRTEAVLPVARGIGLVVFVPIAIVVSGHHFDLALWVLAMEGAFFLLITWMAALRAGAGAETVEATVDVVA